MPDINHIPRTTLVAINARYAHAALGVRYLLANLTPAQRAHAQLQEFTLSSKVDAMVPAILADNPDIVGISVYIWNVDEVRALLTRLRQAAPALIIVLGGPEVSHELDAQPWWDDANHIVCGWGDLVFSQLIQAYTDNHPQPRVLYGGEPPLKDIALPYAEYTDRDLAERHIYVEASRGCPFRCSFCLSALDRRAWPFAQADILQALAQLYQRGARQFRFVDRTFNLKPADSAAILDFFLERADSDLFLHFEVIPDHLPDALKTRLPKFPSGCLQLEIGIQSLNPDVQQVISRRQNNEASLANIRWLRTHTRAHLHVDLIAGLPGEDLKSFARGFDTLYAAGPQEVQLGILKRLRGTPLTHLSDEYAMQYTPEPPYQVHSTAVLSEPDIFRIGHAARIWDRIANSGRFPNTLPVWLGATPFAHLMGLTDFILAQRGQSHALGPEDLAQLLQDWALSNQVDLRPSLVDDFEHNKSLAIRSRQDRGRARQLRHRDQNN